MITYYFDKGIFWFRLFGHGLAGKRIADHPLLFSERNGYTRTVQMFGWSFKRLRGKR